ITALQIVTVILSRGDVYLLGEAYAFGIVWSFFLKALSVLVLRFQRRDQEYKTPLNIRLGSVEIPMGLVLTTGILFFVAIANLVSKRIATISGVTFMLILFVIFTISEKLTHRKGHKGLEQFNLDVCSDVENEKVGARPGCVLVAVRDFNRLTHLASVLQKTNTRKHDIVVVAVRNVTTGAGEYELSESQLFTHYEQELFSRVVALAEKEGKTVELLVVPGIDAFDALVQTAAKLQASRLVTGVSARGGSEEAALRLAQ